MTLSVDIAGRCECGSVHYRVTARAGELYHCHCSRCRRLHGTLFATYAYCLRKHVRINDGQKKLSTYSSPLAQWHFCSECGCHLFAEHDHNPGVMWYMPATLDENKLPGHPAETEKHIFVASRSAIEPISQGLPEYDEYAPADKSITSQKGVAT